jgi:hypothetical protein
MNPPRLSERLLRLLLTDRDRETITGDLLEEYREIAVPARGERGARRWYRRQVASFAWRANRLPLVIGVAIGMTLGVLNLIGTARAPLADDDAASMLLWFTAVIAIWGIASVAVTWRAPRFVDAVKTGAIVGVATILVFHALSIVRVVVFLDSIQYRDDWRNLVVRYRNSGFHSLRAFATYEYVAMTPTIAAIGTLAGSASGMLGGIVGRWRRS